VVKATFKALTDGMPILSLRTEVSLSKVLTVNNMASYRSLKEAQSRPEHDPTIQALGLGKINRTVEVELTPQIAGMISKVNHLITVKEL
jgi:large subunit ribosomal protein L30